MSSVNWGFCQSLKCLGFFSVILQLKDRKCLFHCCFTSQLVIFQSYDNTYMCRIDLLSDNPSHGHVGFFCPVEHKHGTTLLTDPPRDQTQAGTFCICIETQKEIVVNFNIFSRGNSPILQPSQSTLLSMFVFAKKKIALSRCMRILNTSIFKNWMFNLSVILQ